MLIHSWKVAGTVNSPLVTKGTFQFPTHGLAVVVNKNSPLAAAQRVVNFYFTTPAKP